MENENKIAVFKQKQIRRIIHNNEWWFSVQDVAEALADSKDPRQYIKKMRRRDAADVFRQIAAWRAWVVDIGFFGVAIFEPEARKLLESMVGRCIEAKNGAIS
ncbi:MAG: hypothetical protein A2Y40_03745 [Candidatus Margulisbacteria bacterium GWF2_35_9]|nr:MAG: hypothetical protein A2Y40_03745 [Candidatus Margulisbacteria bacterium GWF2_35_9]